MDRSGPAGRGTDRKGEVIKVRSGHGAERLGKEGRGMARKGKVTVARNGDERLG
jgi:hypothetical protein